MWVNKNEGERSLPVILMINDRRNIPHDYPQHKEHKRKYCHNTVPSGYILGTAPLLSNSFLARPISYVMWFSNSTRLKCLLHIWDHFPGHFRFALVRKTKRIHWFCKAGSVRNSCAPTLSLGVLSIQKWYNGVPFGLLLRQLPAFQTPNFLVNNTDDIFHINCFSNSFEFSANICCQDDGRQPAECVQRRCVPSVRS